jgi:hypothetical protein
MLRSSALSLLLTAAAWLALAAPADARSFVIEAHGSQTGLGRVDAIGDFKPERNPRLAAAIRAYGPTTSRRGGGEVCRVRWANLGVNIRFQSFAGTGSSCQPRIGRAQKAVVKGDRRWRTTEGLRLGDRVARITQLYPNAKRTRRGFRLIEGILPFGRPVRYAVLGARIIDGRVAAFTLFVGAAGD